MRLDEASTAIRKKKLAFLMYGDTRGQMRSFLESGIVAKLNDNFEVTVCHENVQILRNSQHVKNLQVQSSPKIHNAYRKMGSLYYLSVLWKFRDRSRCHYARAMLNIGNSKQAIKWRGPVVGRMNLSRLEKIATRFFAATPFFHVLEMSLKLFQIISCNRHYKLFAKKFDLLIIPYSGQIAPDFDFHIWNARRCGLKSLAIQENWDHLSTKSFFRSEPDYFGLWGAQSAGHLRTIQKKEKCEGVILGSPRFNTYNEQADTSSIYVYTDGVPIKVQSKEYILIGGTGDGFDDLEIISTVMKVLGSRVTTHNERLMVVYRPHPFTRTTIDYGSLVATYPQIAIDYGAGRRDTKHLSTLVRNAILNVNLLSTLTLESSISGVPCIVPAYIGEGMNLYGYKEALDEWHHLMGIQLISTVSISHSVEEFTEKLEEKVNSESEEVSVNLDWIVKKQDYISHLCKLVEKLVKD